jgi:hypothetical protein
LTQTQDISLIPTKQLPIAPLDQTEQTLPKEEEEDIPSVLEEAEAEEAEAVEAEEAEAVEEEVAEAVAALPAQEEDPMARTSCSVNTLTPSLEIAPKHESFSHSGSYITTSIMPTPSWEYPTPDPCCFSLTLKDP